ncbi:ParB/RepB/Spo0J family partition protein [Ligaoa zhengdingensis]|uniref:ParB/RepB/Spo0J family partition protein n=1 Tax=Ligaoa zhengdingensis TaxID=2763658 RepID=UPI0031BAB6E3
MIFQKNNRGEQVLNLPLGSIDPNPSQPRTLFDDDELHSLAESIRENGLLQPVTVRRLKTGRYELVSGERRLRACKLLGMAQIRAIAVDVDDQQSAVLALIENLHREGLTFFDEARGIYELIYQWEITQEEAAAKLGMAQSTLANKLRLLRLSPEIQALVSEKGLTERHARALLKLRTPELQREAITMIAKRCLNVAQTERLIEGMLEEKRMAPKRLLIVKDLRIFINTIDRAIDTMKEAGIEAEAARTDQGEYIEYTVKIPKTSAFSRRGALRGSS